MLALIVKTNENRKLNSLESNKISTVETKKFPVRSVTNVDISMATRNVTQKESDVLSAKS